MWNYYGSKSKIVNLYPPPVHRKIIEPFAGSARYALKYWDRDVLLVDKYDVVVNLWNWLKQCSPGDIMKLPRLKKGQDITKIGLDENEQILVGFMASIGVGQPRKIVTDFAAIQMGEKRKSKYKKIADQLHKIRHWEIRCGEYYEIENQVATWFIDPPYQFGGQHQYKFKNDQIDFKKLRNWCLEREGQSIVCENSLANWMSFHPLKGLHGTNSDSFECIWTNIPTSFSSRQQKLF